jgi:hypothetical protein
VRTELRRDTRVNPRLDPRASDLVFLAFVGFFFDRVPHGVNQAFAGYI